MKPALVLAATNRADMIDSALLRPGRFDRVVELGLPAEADRLEILKIHNAQRSLAADVDLGELARKTEGFSGADLEQLSREAAMAALRELIARKGLPPVSEFRIAAKHFLFAYTTAMHARSSAVA